VAKEISRKGHEVIILEQNSRAGEETSSRNSGVIHSGIYYLQALIKRHYVLKEIGSFMNTQREETSGIGILGN